MSRRWSRIRLSGFALCAALAGATASAQNAATDHEQSVRLLVEAFNDQDAEAMLLHFTDDVQWLTIQGSTIGIESGSKDDLRRSLATYFRSCPTCRSRLEGSIATDQRVTFVETAKWQGGAGLREQKSVAVYEFAGPLIRRVYYFPAEESTDRAMLGDVR